MTRKSGGGGASAKKGGGASKQKKNAAKNNNSDSTTSKKGQKKEVNKKRPVPAPIPEDVYEPEHITEEDMEFFAEHKSSLQRFAKNDNSSAPAPKKRRVEKSKQMEVDDDDGEENGGADDLESRYKRERLPEVLAEQEKKVKEKVFKLPIKKRSGEVTVHTRTIVNEQEDEQKIKQVMKHKTKRVKKTDDDDDEEEEEDDEPVVSDDEEEEEVEAVDAQLKRILDDPEMRRERVHEMKKQIAIHCTDILSEPVSNIKKLKFLIDLCQDVDLVVKELSILSLLALFQDLIPDYKINIELIKQEEGKMLSKEIQNLRYFESNLLKYYQDYLKILERWIRKKNYAQLHYISVKCMCELLVRHSHFNFASNIIKTVVPYLSYFRNTQVCSTVYDNLVKLFESDLLKQNGSISLEIVEHITDFVLRKKYRVTTFTLDCLLALPLKTVLKDKTLPDKKKPTANKKKGKKKGKLSFDEEIERDMRLAESITSESEKKRYQTDILRLIVLCYVRLLKNPNYHTNPSLLFCVLTGLSKFSHLLNIDLLYDLLSYLKIVLQAHSNFVLNQDSPGKQADMGNYSDLKPVEKEEADDDDEAAAGTSSSSSVTRTKSIKKIEMSIDILLQSVITTSKLLRGMGSALNIDIHEFYASLYELITQIIFLFERRGGYKQRSIRLLVDALYWMILKSNGKLPEARVASFAKRLMLFALSSNDLQVSIIFLTLTQQIFLKYPSIYDQFFSGEECGIGAYNPETGNPDQANPFATTLWETMLLSHHFHPILNSLVLSLLNFKQNIKKLSALTSTQLQTIITNYTFYNYYLDNGDDNNNNNADDNSSSSSSSSEKKVTEKASDDNMIYQFRFNPALKAPPTNHPLQSKYAKLQRGETAEAADKKKKKKKKNKKQKHHIFYPRQIQLQQQKPSEFLAEIKATLAQKKKEE